MFLILHNLNHAVTSTLVTVEILTTSVWFRIAALCVSRNQLLLVQYCYFIYLLFPRYIFCFPVASKRENKFYIS